VGFDITDQLLINFFWHSSDTGEKVGVQETVHQLFIDFKKFCESVKSEVLYNILIELGVL
jgi:hypothetical protein